MAQSNANYASGLTPIRSPNGETPHTIKRPLKQAYSSVKYSTVIAEGSLVKWGATGWIVHTTLATKLVGVAAEPYLGSSASTQTYLNVYPILPGQHWGVQLKDSDGATDSSYLIGKVCDWTDASSYHSDSGISKLQAWAPVTTAGATTGPLAIEDIQESPGYGGAKGAYPRLVVRFSANASTIGDVTAGFGP